MKKGADFDKVKTDDISRTRVRRPWKPFLRQLYVCSGVWVIYFVLGLGFGAPTVFIPQIRKAENSTEVISLEMESWLTSVHGYSALPFVIIIPIITQMLGRKKPFIIVCINTTIGYLVFYWSNNTTLLLLSEIWQGMLLASNLTLLIVIITEYTSPHYRGIFLAIESSIFFWGVWVANAVGTFSYWKNIGLIAFACCGFCLSAFFWPESPSWLAMKGRFDECAASHYWLKGYGAESKEELYNLISSQKQYIEKCKNLRVNTFKDKFRRAIETVTTRTFYQPLLLCVAVMSLYHFSGKLVCTMYAVELIHQITKDEYTAYIGMLILEAVTIFGMQVGCIISKYIKRRTWLLLFSAIGILFLFMISFYLYMVRLDVLVENKFVSITLMMMFSVTISIGPMVIPACLFGELIFLRYKSSSLLILTFYSEFLMATILKISPFIFKILTLHGAFFFYGVCASIFTLVLYKYLPETKDKTLNEIENYFLNPLKSKYVANELISERDDQLIET